MYVSLYFVLNSVIVSFFHVHLRFVLSLLHVLYVNKFHIQIQKSFQNNKSATLIHCLSRRNIM